MRKRVLVPPSKRRKRITGAKNGAPFGNQNALKHGKRTRQRRTFFAAVRTQVHACRALLEDLGFRKKPNTSSRGVVERV